MELGQNRLTVIASGLVIVAVAAVVGYGLGTLVERRLGPSPSPLVTPREETPVPDSPSPASTPAPSSTPTPAPPPPLQVGLRPLPTVVKAGVPFVIRWQIHGPPGTVGSSTHVVVAPDHGVSVSSAATASFSVPAAFASTVTVSTRGKLTVTAAATVNNQTLQASRMLRIE